MNAEDEKGGRLVSKLGGRGAILVGTKRVGGVVAHRLAREGVNLAIVYRSSQAGGRASE